MHYQEVLFPLERVVEMFLEESPWILEICIEIFMDEDL